MKETIYRTIDSTTDAQSHKQQATAKLLNSLKNIVQKEKMNGTAQCQPVLTNKEKQIANPKKQEEHAHVWHLATFSSPEQLTQIKEKQAQATHEMMLHKELAKFRIEVEGKFRSSETNAAYVFPRLMLQDSEPNNERIPSASDPLDCKVKT